MKNLEKAMGMVSLTIAIGILTWLFLEALSTPHLTQTELVIEHSDKYIAMAIFLFIGGFWLWLSGVRDQ